jgi:lipopolysaccharide export system permease protein
MNKIILNYIIKNFFHKFFIVVGVFYCFGLILNLFEEVEFFKTLDVSIFTPLMLTSIYIPSLLIKILPFIIFISSMWFMLSVKFNKDLLTFKVFGYSNIKIFNILAISAFFIGLLVLFIINPITSSMSKYYENIKSNYSRDVDHLISFKRDGLWIKEKLEKKQRYISSKKLENKNLKDVTIFHLDENSLLIEKIIAEKANIAKNNWLLSGVDIFRSNNGVFEKFSFDKYEINSIYNSQKISNLFKNFDTMAFTDLLLNFESLLEGGYNKNFLDQSLHSLLALPFFLSLMTGLASILTMNNLTKNNNLKMTIIGLAVVVIVYYFKDFSLALGQIEKVPLILSIWAPIIALSLFTLIGIIQINEK